MPDGIDLRALALPIFALLILIEIYVSARRGKPAYAWGDFWGSMSQLAGNIIVQVMTRGAIFGLYVWLSQFRIFTLPTDLIGLILHAVAIDFVFYWFHRTSHRVNLFWAVHVSHHSSQLMNLGAALRQPWLGPLAKVPFYWPLPLLGFDPLTILAVGSALTLYGFWTHTEQIDQLGPFEWIFVSPSHHRVHHGSNRLYIDKNYANFLIIWDRLFGTFQAETEPVRYGLTENLRSHHPWTIATHVFARMWQTLRARPSLQTLKHVAFGTPEQQQAPSEETARP